MKKISKIIGATIIFILFSSLSFGIVYAVDEVVNISAEKVTGEGSGGWVYEDSTTSERSATFVSRNKCEKYREDNQLLTSTTNCYSVYKLLAPILNLTEAPNNIGDYFNIIFKIAIGLCGALAVVMIIIGGFQYMGDESIFGKTEAKSKIISAIFGLLIALGSYALLNTINPDLLGTGVNIKAVSAEVIDLPDAGDGEIDPDFAKKDYKYSTNASVSPEVTNVVNKIKNEGWAIYSFKVYPNERMLISLVKGGVYDNTNVIDVRSGINGFSEVGQGTAGDRKTPKGVWKIIRMTTPGSGIPVYNKQGSNMGASFWLLSPTVSGERGIGMHGNKTGTLSRTYGCVRLKNADLLALLPYVKTGTTVIINN